MPTFTTGLRLMQRPSGTISIAFVRGLLSGVRAQGRPCEDIVTEAGISPALLLQDSARVTADQYIALNRLLIDRLGDEFVGFFSRRLRRGSFALMARSALGAPNLGEAIGCVANSFYLLQEDVVLAPLRERALAGLGLRFANPAVARQPFLHEMLLRKFWIFLTWLAAGKLRAARFDFAFEAPLYVEGYRQIFPAPLLFAQPQSGFWFDAARLQDPVRRDEGALRTFLDDYDANIIVPWRYRDTVSRQVRQHLHQSQPRWPDLASTAEAMHRAPSTLQKQLANEGTSFKTLKEELRRDIAVVSLNTRKVPLGIVAYELGFASSASFQRAFKGWTGSAPGAYRRGQA